MSSPLDDRVRYARLRNRSTRAFAVAQRRAAEAFPESDFLRHRLSKSSRRVRLCADAQSIFRVADDDGSTRLINSNTRRCRVRGCPQCDHIKSVEHQRKLVALYDTVLERHPNARALFLTTTTRNRPWTVKDIREMLADHNAGMKRLFKHPRIQAATLGAYSTFECPIRRGKRGYECGLHAHSVVMVDAGRYFAAGGSFISQPEWVSLWQSACRLSYKPILWVSVLRGHDGEMTGQSLYSALRELTKYLAVGFFDHTASPGDITVDPKLVSTFSEAFYRRRATRYDRCFAEAAKLLRKRRLAEPAGLPDVYVPPQTQGNEHA